MNSIINCIHIKWNKFKTNFLFYLSILKFIGYHLLYTLKEIKYSLIIIILFIILD